MISDEKLQSKLNIEPHKEQERMINCDSDLKVCCAGRRGGKTFYAAYEATKKILQENQNIWVVAPNYELTKKVIDEVLRNLGKLFGSSGFNYRKKPTPVVEMKSTGSKIKGKSAENPKSMLGSSTDLIIVDEAAIIDKEIYDQYLEPTTIDRNGDIILISTPRGQNWFYDKWLNAGEGQFKFTSLDNPNFPKERWEKLKQEKPKKIFAQEYEAKFISSAGSVFRGIDDIVGDEQCQPEEGVGYIMGVDLGKQNDFSCCVVVDRTTNKVVWIDRFNELSYNLQKKRILNLAEKYNNAKIVIDHSGIGDPIVDDLKRHAYVEPLSLHSIKNKQQLIEKLAIYVEQKNIEIPRHDVLLKELKQYAYNVTSRGYRKYHAPKGKHDDTVIALALAVWGLRPKRSESEEDEEERRRRLKKTFNDYK